MMTEISMGRHSLMSSCVHTQDSAIPEQFFPPPAMMVYKEFFPEGEVAVIEVQPSEDTPVRYNINIKV